MTRQHLLMDAMEDGRQTRRCDLCKLEQPAVNLMPAWTGVMCRDYNACYERRRKPREENR